MIRSVLTWCTRVPLKKLTDSQLLKKFSGSLLLACPYQSQMDPYYNTPSLILRFIVILSNLLQVLKVAHFLQVLYQKPVLISSSLPPYVQYSCQSRLSYFEYPYFFAEDTHYAGFSILLWRPPSHAQVCSSAPCFRPFSSSAICFCLNVWDKLLRLYKTTDRMIWE